MKITIQRITAFLGLSLLVVGVALFATATLGNPSGAEIDSDILLIAKEKDLPLEEVADSIAFQDAFGKYVKELTDRYPDQISSIWTETVPSTKGHIQFVGEVPLGLEFENVVFIGGGMITREEHGRRASLAADALLDLGYQNYITFPDYKNNVIQIELRLPEGTPQPSKADIVGAPQDRVHADQTLQGRAATVYSIDLELTVIRGSGPIFTSEHSPSEVRVDKSDKSPLATWDPKPASIFNDATSGSGTLDISASCVRLVLDSQETVLLFWAEPTTWNASSQVIEFVSVRGERIELRDGDRIMPSGATPGGGFQFVSPPDPSCEADETFTVNSLRLVED